MNRSKHIMYHHLDPETFHCWLNFNEACKKEENQGKFVEKYFWSEDTKEWKLSSKGKVKGGVARLRHIISEKIDELMKRRNQ